MSAQLDSFVRECLARGIPRAVIREKLRATITLGPAWRGKPAPGP